MRHDEIRSRVMGTDADDWHQIVCWGGGGPSYLNSFGVWTTSDGQMGFEIESHSNLAVLREDVDLKIAWGLNTDRDGSLTFPWQNNFADNKVTKMFIDILWRDSLVDREVVVSVDGGRALLPLGTLQ